MADLTINQIPNSKNSIGSGDFFPMWDSTNLRTVKVTGEVLKKNIFSDTLTNQGILKYNNTTKKAETLPIPEVSETHLEATVNDDEISYEWKPKTDKTFICTSSASDLMKTIKIPGLTSLYIGLTVRVLFQNKNTYSSDTYFAISGLDSSVGQIKVYKAGALQSLTGRNGYWLDAPTKTYEVWQAGTVLELMWNGSSWIVMGNPLLENWSVSWDSGGTPTQAGYRVYADGYTEVWDMYYITTALTTITYNETSFTNAGLFKVEFTANPSMQCSPAGGGSNTAVQQTEFLYACCPIGWRRAKGTSGNWQCSYKASGY